MDNEDHYEALLDGCDGDSEGLRAALGGNYTVVASDGSDLGYGHHNYTTTYLCEDGRTISADCGGCSCGGSGNWDYVDAYKAWQYVPEQDRKD